MKSLQRNIVAASIALGILSFAACQKSFLDDPKPTDQVSEQDVFASENNIRAYFTGIYNLVRSDYVSHDTDGSKSYDIAYEVMGDDIILPGGGWYNFDYQIDNSRSTYRRVTFTWNYFYKIVNHANVIIDGLASSPISDHAKVTFEAEAKAIRAWAYFNLIRAFQHTYLKDKDAMGVPIYTVPTSAENKGNPRASVEEVYNLIVSDLQFASANLESSRQFKFIINKEVAFGLLARVYLTMGEWQNAEEAAFAGLASYGVTAGDYSAANIQKALTAADYGNGFNNYNSNEWLWGVPLRNDQTLYYRSFFSFYDHDRSDGYKNFYINNAFVDQFSDSDVRNLFELVNGYYVTTKFRDLPDLSGSFVLMRSSELVLIIAESRAEESDLANARSVLFALQSNRDTEAAIITDNTKESVISEILLERRKELYGEIGVMVQDLKRRQLPLTRTGNHAAAYLKTYPENYIHFIFQIPQAEIDANENIGPEDQNP